MRYSPRSKNGLGMLRLAVFWQSVRMSWLKRMTTMKSTWKAMHREEVGNKMFDPTNSNMESLEAAKAKIKNPVW